MAHKNRGQYTQILVYVVSIAIMLLLSNCGGTLLSSDSELNSHDDYSEANVLAGSITSINTTDSSEISLQFDSLTDEENVLLVLFSYSDSTSSSGFQLGSDSASLSEHYLTQDDVTEDFHNSLRELENSIDPLASPATSDDEVKYLKYASIGSIRSFKVITSTSSTSEYETVTATLRYTNSNVEFYVDNRNAASLSDETLENMADQFPVNTERDIFGRESDVDSNGKFAVLFTQAVNALGASSGGLVTGFFYAIDLFDDTLYEASNEMEVFYTIVPDPEGELGTAISESFTLTNLYPTVLPHEFQHMINFNQHYFLNAGSAEESWLNEGLSHLAEDLINIDGNDYMTETSLENPSRVSAYLSSIDGLCVSCGSSLSQRGGSYLLLRYLYEQAELGNIAEVSDGATLIEYLLNTTETGVDNLKTALFGDNTADEAFNDIMGEFALAVYFSNTNTFTDSHYNFQGINLRSLQDDNRNTTLSGPSLTSLSSLPFTDTLSGLSLSYITLTGADINDNGAALDFSISSNAQIGGYLIRE